MRDDAFFGTDGIRDRFGSGRLSPENLVRIGRAYGSFVRDRLGTGAPVLVGRDTRESGPRLLAGLARGLTAEGVTALDAGVLPTPAVAWWAAGAPGRAAIALTASHNPAPDNGVKAFLDAGRKTTPEEEADLEARIARADPHGVPAAGRVEPRDDVRGAYVAAAVAFLAPAGRLDGLRLCVDHANGAARETAPAVLAALGATVTVASPEGGAINDGCGTEHPAAWVARVRALGADAGLAFDGDADRVLLCDPRGEVLDGDRMLYLLAHDLHADGALPGDVVVATVMSNLGLERALAANGVRLDRVPVGDRHVAARMRETSAALGGEQSGHVLLRWGGALLGDGLVAGVRALQAARRRGIALDEVAARVPRFPQRLRNVPVERRVPFECAPDFVAAVEREERALAGTGRVLVRYSGTEPLLRIMVEASDEAAVVGVLDRLEAAAALLDVNAAK